MKNIQKQNQKKGKQPKGTLLLSAIAGVPVWSVYAAARKLNKWRAAETLRISSESEGARASLEVARQVAESKRGQLSWKESASPRNMQLRLLSGKRAA